MKGRVAGVPNLAKVAEEVLRGKNFREAELRNFSNNAKKYKE
jgi:hypothetical protein